MRTPPSIGVRPWPRAVDENMNSNFDRSRWSGAANQDDDRECQQHQQRADDKEIAGNPGCRSCPSLRRRFSDGRLGVSRVGHYALVTKSLFDRPTRRAESWFRNYAAGTVAASKNRAWAIAAFTVER